MSVINGVAKKYDGTAIDYVSIFNWDDGKCIAQVIPDALGAWDYGYYRDLRVGLTYVADGCSPITHGVYSFEYKAIIRKWWRIKNIVIRKPDYLYGEYSRAAAEVRFLATTGEVSTDPSKIFIYSSAGVDYQASKALDGNSNTFFHNRYPDNLQEALAFFVGYEFEYPVTLSEVKIQLRPDMTPDYGQEWQTADIECSDDGVTWIKYGHIEPRIAQMDLSLITTPVIID